MYPDYIPFEIFKKVIEKNSTNRFTIEQFSDSLVQMIDIRNEMVASGKFETTEVKLEKLSFMQFMMKLNVQF